MKNYYVESNSRWFVVRCGNKKLAFSIGKKKLGRQTIIAIREAKESEVKDFIRQKGKAALSEEY